MKKLQYILFIVSVFVLFINPSSLGQILKENGNNSSFKKIKKVENTILKSKISTNFFPNKIGDFWEYIEEDTTSLFGQQLVLKFSISREVISDTTMSNGITYSKIKWHNEANSVNYPTSFDFIRVDSTGKIFIYFNSNDHLLFDTTLGVNQTYSSHLLYYYWKILDKYTVIGFGDTLQSIDFGLFDQNNMMVETYSLVEKFGIVSYQKDLLNYALPNGKYWGAVINGQEYGTLIVKKQTVDWEQFYPLHIGDYWVYEGEDGGIPTTNTVRVISDTLMSDGFLYYKLEEIDYTFGYKSFTYQRIDSLGKVYYWEYWNNLPKKHFEFSQIVGDTLSSFSDFFNFRLDDKYLSMSTGLFELHYYLYPDLGFIRNDYDLGIGLYKSTGEQVFSELAGAYINGSIVWGDTTITSIEDSNFIISNNYIIYPCYPNPFNSSSTLTFYTPVSAEVEINIYNTLGEKVRSLLNKNLSNGYHKQLIDANGLSSGVYFVVLITKDIRLASKIVYLK